MALTLGTLQAIAQPANDNFNSAEPITGNPGSTSGDSTGATLEPGEPRHFGTGGASIWYRWTATNSGVVTFDTVGSAFDTVLVAYLGTNLTSLLKVAGNDDADPSTTASRISFSAVAGVEYRLAVDGYLGAAGALILNWQPGLVPQPTPAANAGALGFVFGGFSVTEFESRGFIDDVRWGQRWAGGALITVIRTGGTAGRVLVDYSALLDGGTNGLIPYGNGTLTFDDYQMSASFVLPVAPGSGTADQTVFLSLADPRADDPENPSVIAPTLFNTDATLNILALGTTNINGGTNFSIEKTRYFVEEAPRVGNPFPNPFVVVDVICPAGGPGEVDYQLFPGLFTFGGLSAGSDHAHDGTFTFPSTPFTDGATTITEGPDYQGGTIRLRFGNGQTRISVTNFIFNDSLVEFNEDIRVKLIAVANNPPLGRNPEANITILFDDPPAGALDREWNPDNVPSTTPRFNSAPGANGPVRAVAVQDDQRAVIAGDFTAYNSVPRGRIARIHFDGSIDNTFNPGSGANGSVTALALYPNAGTFNDGKIVIAGNFTSVNNIQRSRVARLNGDGSLDNSFNPGSGANGSVRSVAIQSDGKIIVAGEFTQFRGVDRNRVARLQADGTLDFTFNTGSGADGTVWSVAVRDGQQNVFSVRVAEAGKFEDINEIETGGTQGTITIDYNFGTDLDNLRVYYEGFRLLNLTTNGVGQRIVSFGPGTSTKVTIAVNEGGLTAGGTWRYTANIAVPLLQRSIFVGGEFLNFNGQYRGGIARLNDNGALDAGYDPGGGANGPVYVVAAQPDGRLLVGGAFASLDFRRRGNIARLDTTGALDLSFDPGTGADYAVYSITLQPDGKPLVGGVFTSFNQTRRVGLTRLFVNGTVDTSFLDTAYNQFAGVVKTYDFEPANYVNSIALQTNGDVMIGGSFTSLGGNASRQLYTNQHFGVFWTRADKRTRYNVARLYGGYTPGPGNVEFVSSEYTVDENAISLNAALRRVDGRVGGIFGLAKTVDNLAVAGMDFDYTKVTASWPQGFYTGNTNNISPESVGYVGETYLSTAINNDRLIEGDELFNLSLAAPQGFLFLGGEFIPLGAALGRAAATATIVDNDFSRGTFAFSSATYLTNENAGFLHVTVVRTNGSYGQVSVQYFTRNGTALAGQDFTGITMGTLRFDPGETSQSFNIALNDDNVIEPDETFTITLTNASGGAVLPGGLPTSTVSATAIIIDNDLLSGRANFASVFFTTNENAGAAQITLLRLGGSVGELSVNVASTNGTATEGDDFLATTNVVTWVDGDVAPKVFPVPLLSDSIVEPSETVRLRLFDPSVPGGIGITSNATLVIQNDDFPGSLSFSQPLFDADERGTNVTITVLRAGGAGGTVSVSYIVANGTAINGTDFIAANGTLTFGPDVLTTNFSITILNNGLQDGERRATLILTNFSLASTGAYPVAILRIMDDESVGDPAGSVDTTFSPLAGGTNEMHALALQADGKLLVGGEFRTLNRVLRNRVGRLNPDGSLDETFDAKQGPNAAVRALALQPDGRIVLGGFFERVGATNRNHIARLLTDGTVDAQFNPGAGADNPVYALAVLPDRRVVIGGAFASVDAVPRAGIAVLEADGTVSTAFNAGLGVNGTVLALAVQGDGKILVGGTFTVINGVTRPYLARLNLDGSVDPTFDTGTGPSGAVHAITLQPDGKILIGGSFTNIDSDTRNHLARLMPTGAVDGSFLSAAEGADDNVTGIALQFDGELIVVGEFTHFNAVTRNRITRLYRSGKTDPTINFGDGANDRINAVVIQPDRKIVVAGRFTQFDNEPRSFLARIYGGSIAGPGSLQFSSPFYSVTEDVAQAVVAVERRGGTTSDITVDYFSTPGTATPGVDYTDVTGTLSFAEGETRMTFTVAIVADFVGEPNETVALSLTNQTAGAVLGAVPNATLVILNDDSGVGFSAANYTVNEGVVGGNVLIDVLRSGATNGTVTVNFATANGTARAGQDYVARSGLLTFAPGETVQSFSVPILDDLLIEPTESFRVTLSNLTGAAALGLASATVTILDNDFQAGTLRFSASSYSVAESGGSVGLTVLRTNGTTGSVSVDYVIVPGTAQPGSDYIDQSGTLKFDEGQTSQTITIAILDDNLVEGDENLLVRLFNPGNGAVLGTVTNATVTILDEEVGPGSLDRSFDPGRGASGLVRALALQPDGKVVVGGAFTMFDGTNRNFIARLNADGSHDLTFDPGTGADGFVSAVGVSPSGRVLLGGAISSVNGIPYNRLAQLNSDGTPDATFDHAIDLNSEVYTLTVQANGRVLLGGAFSLPTRGISRVRANGTVDPTFSPGSGADGPVHWIAVQPDGAVVLGGGFTTLNGEPHARVGRLSSEGQLDIGFATDVITNGTVFGLAVQTDGKIVVGGDFNTIGGTNPVRIARLNADGTLDTSFNVGLGANATVFAVGLDSSGKALVAGDFTTIDGAQRNRYARLNTDGSLDLTFEPGLGADNTVLSLIVLPSDDILLGGDFTVVTGIRRNGVARIHGGAPAPTIVAASVSGGVSLTLSSRPGVACILEASQDLVNWTPISTNATATGTCVWTDPDTSLYQTRFFRVREVVP
jgi:uncharacterized delta-60 repeat protein